MSYDPTIHTYDKYAQVYDQEVEDFWNEFPMDFVDKFISLLPGKRILNLGSGSGRDATLLRNTGLDVICIDASKAMIAITTELGFESYLATFEDMDLPESMYDGVWAYTSLIHIKKEDAKKAVHRIRSTLKPNGIFAIGVIEGNTAGMVERKTMPGASRYFKNYTSEELKAMMTQIGFTFLNEQRYKPHNNVYLNQLYVAKK